MPISWLFLLPLLSSTQVALQNAGGQLKSSPIALTSDGRMLAVVNPDSGSLSLVDTTSGGILAEVAVGAEPQTVAVDALGRFAFAAVRAEDEVAVVDLDLRERLGAFMVDDEPFGVLVDGSGRLFVSCEMSDRVLAIDATTGEEIAAIGTAERPRGLALSSDPARLYVTHFLSGRLTVIDSLGMTVTAIIDTGLPTNVSQSVLIDATAKRAYLPQTRSNTSNQALLFDTTVFPVVSVVDLDTGQNLLRDRLALDIADEPVSLPLDAALTQTDKLYVVNAGSNDVSVIDLPTGKGVAHLEVGHNPRGIVLDPDETTAYVNNTLSGSVSVIEVATDTVIDELVVTDIPLPPDVLNGKILFNSSARPDLARDQWISCAVCHFDGEMDGRTWFFADGPRNTPSLLGVGQTLPIHWSGDLDELQDVEATVRRIQVGTGLAAGPENCDPACDQAPPNTGRSEDLDDLAAFMRTLEVPPSFELLPGGKLSPAAARGRALFESVELGCTNCHIAPLYTDRQRHDVGTASSPLETKGSFFDTPSLRGVRKTAPYLHDGSAATLLDVLTLANLDDRHGRTSGLSQDQLDDLVQLLEALPFEEARRECVADAETLCLQDGRFNVRVDWSTGENTERQAQAVALTTDTGYFWFFNPNNVELVVKVLNACSFSGHFWVFAGGLTDVGVSLTVTDTQTGAFKIYTNLPGTAFQPVQDTAAFDSCVETGQL